MSDVSDRLARRRTNRTPARKQRRKTEAVLATPIQVQQQQAADKPPEDFNHLRDPQYWQRRAEETRRIAAGMSDGKTKETMLDIANKYDVIARLAAERLARRRPKSN